MNRPLPGPKPWAYWPAHTLIRMRRDLAGWGAAEAMWEVDGLDEFTARAHLAEFRRVTTVDPGETPFAVRVTYTDGWAEFQPADVLCIAPPTVMDALPKVFRRQAPRRLRAVPVRR